MMKTLDKLLVPSLLGLLGTVALAAPPTNAPTVSPPAPVTAPGASPTGSPYVAYVVAP